MTKNYLAINFGLITLLSLIAIAKAYCVLAAMGRSGVPFDPTRIRIWLGDIPVCHAGVELPFSEAEAIRYLKNKEILIRVNLGLGHKKSRYLTCDYTGQYVGINAGYRT